MGSTPSPPTPPDPVATASAQGASNVSVASAQSQLNNINQVTPYGSLIYNQTGQGSTTNPDGTVNTFPTYTSTQSLSPEQQRLYNQQTDLGYQANNAASQELHTINQSMANPVTEANLPGLTTSLGVPSLTSSYDAGGPIQSSVDWQRLGTDAPSTFGQTAQGIQGDVNLNTNAPTTFGPTAGRIQYGLGNTDFSADRDAATNAVLQRLAPTMASQGEALNAQLASQGLTQGSAAWNAAQLSQNQANNDLRLGAVQTGDAEQQALYGERLSTGQFNNSAQQQDNEQQLGRGAFAQAGTKQNNDALLDEGNFHNAAQQQDFGQQQARGEFAQNAYGMNNAAIGANNGFAFQEGAFTNAAQAQRNSENQQAAAFSNNAAQGLFGMNQAAATFGNQAREQSLSDQETINNNAVNQVSALMHGGQVTNGQYQAYNPAQIGQTPISADTYASANLAEQGYETQAKLDAQNNSAMFSALGGLFGMGTKMMSGGMV